MIVTIDANGDGGIMRDPWAPDMRDGAWSDGKNITFGDGYVSRTKGHTAPYGQAPIRPYATFPLTVDGDRRWVLAGLERLYMVDGEGQYHNISRRLSGGQSWTFASDAESWTAGGGTAGQAAGELVLTKTGGDGNLHGLSPGSQTINGSQFTRIRLKVRADSGGTFGTCTIFYTSVAGGSSGGFSNDYRKVVPLTLTTDSQEIVVDMAQLTVGGDDWLTSTITQLRISFASTVDGSIVRFDEIELEGDELYSTDADIGWQGTFFNGVLVLNNGIDVPQAYGGTGTAIDMPNWPADLRCKFIRAYKNQLVAGNITDNGTRYPHMVLWSHVADPGALPSSWDVTDPALRAGQRDIADDQTELVDAATLGGQLIVYKEGSYHSLEYVGGAEVMSRQPISSSAGLLGLNCVAEFPGGHVVVGQGDVYIHAGGPPQSIIDARMRRWLFDTIDTSQVKRVFAVTNLDANEVWIGLPTGGDYGCSVAAIWNWKSGAWTIRDLPGVSGGSAGVVDIRAITSWAALQSAGVTWDDLQTTAWSQIGAIPSAQRLMLASPQGQRIYLTGQGGTFDQAAISAEIQREGLHLRDSNRHKLLRGVRPIFDALPGTVVQMRMGAAYDQARGTEWSEWRDYVIGDDEWFHDFVSGKYLAFAIRSSGANDWRLRQILLDVEPQGVR